MYSYMMMYVWHFTEWWIVAIDIHTTRMWNDARDTFIHMSVNAFGFLLIIAGWKEKKKNKNTYTQTESCEKKWILNSLWMHKVKLKPLCALIFFSSFLRCTFALCRRSVMNVYINFYIILDYIILYCMFYHYYYYIT